MEKITRRTVVCLFLALLLLAGVCLFVVRFFTQGNAWAGYAANDHLYRNGVLAAGAVLDREGEVLARAGDEGWEYHDDYSVRLATLHAVGDSQGKIGVGAVTSFADKLSGYNTITGARTLFGGQRQLYLTLDAELCAAAYQAMDGLKGCIGLYNYRTGEILCLVSAPSFDPRNPETVDETDPAFDGVYINRFISSAFIPGSTFKLVTMAAAYERLPQVLQSSYSCSGSYDFEGHYITCPYPHGEGLILQTALTASCNCVYGQLAVELGSHTMEHYAEKCGLTQSYSINGLHTAASTFDFNTDDGYLAWSGVGQGFDLVNPCSMLVFVGAIANGGRAARPQLISRLTNGGGLPLSLYVPRQERLLEKETAAYLKQAMRDDVSLGYGSYHFSGLDVGAKTGTAQADDKDENNAWFVGFVAEEDHPYAFVVYLEGGGAGSGKALSAAGSLLSATLRQGY